jgi:hypothetical protein
MMTLACLISFSAIKLLSAENFEITVLRQYVSEKCTSGYLAVNGKIICYSLERPWKDNQENISSIPSGRYSALLRYDKKDKWRIQLKNVPGRTGVQIHIGNEVDQSKGCVLVGAKLNDDLCSLQESSVAYKKLKSEFYGSENPTATPDKSVFVVIKDGKTP